MTSAYLTLNMSESNDFSISQRIEREVPSSFSELDKRKQKRKEVAIFVKVLLDYLERANELELKQITKNVSKSSRNAIKSSSCLTFRSQYHAL
jgi:hypothetical protein